MSRDIDLIKQLEREIKSEIEVRRKRSQQLKHETRPPESPVRDTHHFLSSIIFADNIRGDKEENVAIFDENEQWTFFTPIRFSRCGREDKVRSFTH